MKEEYEIKFWKDWLEGDHVKRLELVKKVSIIKEALEIDKLPEAHSERILVTALNSFFEDLESAVYTKIRLEKKRKL